MQLNGTLAATLAKHTTRINQDNKKDAERLELNKPTAKDLLQRTDTKIFYIHIHVALLFIFIPGRARKDPGMT
jgi:hypothetical protein